MIPEHLIEKRDARMSVDVSTVPIDGELRNVVKYPSTRDPSAFVLYGDIYGDRKGRFADGTNIHTSLIVKIDGDVALTLNSAYRLIDYKDSTNDD